MASVSQVTIASGSFKTNRNISQINDSLYLFYKPPADTPKIQILFFHGLQRDPDYSNAHVSTWENRDGSCIWPQTWLVEEFPRAHVLSVCYTEGLKRVFNVPAGRTRVFLFPVLLLALVSIPLLGLLSFVTLFFGLLVLLLWQFKRRERGLDGRVDMYIIAENLLSDLLDEMIGSSCPVVLVGHSIGGLVIKQLCKYAHSQLSTTREPEKARLTTFLNSIKGIFFYSTPHHGSAIASRLKQHFGSHFLEYFETLSIPTSRLNSEFEQISKEHYKWSLAGLGETLPTDMGAFEEVVVEEASSRGTVDKFYSVPEADHFSICRPINKTLASFGKLTAFIGGILKDFEDYDDRLPLPLKIQDDDDRLPLPFMEDPKYVGLKKTLITVKQALESKTPGRVIILFGASGEGKTSMARHLALYFQNADRRSPDGVQAEELGTQNSASRRFRDGVIFLTCSSKEVIISPLLELWKKLGYDLLPLIEAKSGNASSTSGIQESSIPEKVLEDALNKKIRAQKILIILDDVQDSALIQKFLRIVGESLKFLITTQNSEIWADRNCKQIPIGTPTSEEACHILKNHAYGRPTDITQPIQDAIDAIVEKAACHPLVLANVAANIQGESGNDLEEWENARRNFEELVEDDATNPTVFLYDEMYPRTVEASIKMTLSTLSKEVETKSLLLLASIFESQSTPEVVFRLFAKRLHGRLAKFSRWSKRLQDTNFIRVDFTTDSLTTASERTWFLHPLRQRFIERIEESEVKAMVEGVLERKTDDDDIAVIVLLIVYGQDKWRKQAAKALAIPTPQFQKNDSVQSWSLHLAAVKSFVGLIHANPEEEWEKKSDRLAKRILQEYIYCQEFDDESVSLLLSATETCTHTLKALSNFFALNSARIFIPKTTSAVVKLLRPENSTTLANRALMPLSWDAQNRINIGQSPDAMERLVALLADNVSEATQGNAAYVLANLSLDAENEKKIAQLPNAMERLVALLADNVSEATQENAARALANLAGDAENRVKIAQVRNGVERLVALLADNVSEATQEYAAGALGNLAKDAENEKKIAQLPNAMERLVALLADNVSEATQQSAARALGNLVVDAENKKKIAQLPNAMERLVALLADNVSEATQKNAAGALGNLAGDAENQKKIAQLPNAMERLVALLADNVSEATQKNAARALGNLAVDAENKKKIAQLPNAMERLVALLADNVSEATQEDAVHALGNLAVDAENKKKIAQLPNAMERLVALLADNVSEATQKNAARALGNLAVDAENKKKIAQLPNAMERLVALLADNVSEATQEDAVHALGNLAVDAENKKKIAQLPNAMERLVALLADNVSEATQENAARALGNLAVDAENKKKIAQLPNAMERLVALLADNVSGATQENAARALGNLVGDAENHKKIAQLPNAMERLVALLADNVSEATQQSAARALGNLAGDAENRKKIAQLPNAMERLVALLADNVSEATQEDAVHALGNLAMDAENQKKIAQLPNAMERLVALLADNVSEATQEDAVHALGNLAVDAENHKKIAQLPNAMERLVALLADNVSEATQQSAAHALGNLAGDAENRKKIAQLPNAMERLVALLADNVSEATQKNAAGALGNLAGDAENQKKIAQLPNAMERLVVLLADNVSEATQKYAAGALGNLAMDAENKKKIAQLPNAMERLVALLADNVSQATQEYAACTLGNLAMDAENRKKIAQLPNAMERLVALLADNVSEATQENAARALGNLAGDAENRVKIAQVRNVVERLVALLGENVSENTRSSAGVTLRYLSLGGHAGEYERALEAYENDRVAEAKYILARRCFVKAKRGDFEGALTDINKFIEVGGDRQLGLQERGIVRRMQGDLDGALADLNDSLSLESDDYECLKHRGLVKFLLLDEDGARADAECALRVKPAQVDRNEYGTDLWLQTSSVEYLGYNLK